MANWTCWAFGPYVLSWTSLGQDLMRRKYVLISGLHDMAILISLGNVWVSCSFSVCRRRRNELMPDMYLYCTQVSHSTACMQPLKLKFTITYLFQLVNEIKSLALIDHHKLNRLLNVNPLKISMNSFFRID